MFQDPAEVSGIRDLLPRSGSGDPDLRDPESAAETSYPPLHSKTRAPGKPGARVRTSSGRSAHHSEAVICDCHGVSFFLGVLVVL